MTNVSAIPVQNLNAMGVDSYILLLFGRFLPFWSFFTILTNVKFYY